MATFHPFGSGTYALNSSISSTQTSITLSSFTEPVSGTPYTMVLLNTDIAYGTIAPKTSQAEFISFTGITQNMDGTAILTGVTRGLQKKYPFTTSATFKLAHGGQSVFIISNPPQLYEKYPNRDNDEQINGLWNFAQTPTGINPGGVPDASTTTKGIGKVSVAPVSPTSPIFVGDNDGRVPTQAENDALVGNNTDIAVGTANKYMTQTGFQHNAEKYAVDTSSSSTAYVAVLSPVPTSLTDGMIVYVKCINANTTTIPTLALTGTSTAKTLVKGNNVALGVGDIGANSYNTFQYNGTNLVLISPVASASSNTYYGLFKNGDTTHNANSSTTTTIAHGLGIIPKVARITATHSITGGAGAGAIIFARTVYNGTTQSSQSSYVDGTGGVDTNTFAFNTSAAGTGAQTGVVTFDATNITITWTGTTAGIYILVWEAEA